MTAAHGDRAVCRALVRARSSNRRICVYSGWSSGRHACAGGCPGRSFGGAVHRRCRCCALSFDSGWAQRTTLRIEQAGLRLRVGEYLIMRIGLAAGYVLRDCICWAGMALTMLLAVSGGSRFNCPAIWLTIMRQRRMSEFIEAVAGSYDHALQRPACGIRIPARRRARRRADAEPASEEFTRMIVDMNVGASVEDAINGLLRGWTAKR